MTALLARSGARKQRHRRQDAKYVQGASGKVRRSIALHHIGDGRRGHKTATRLTLWGETKGSVHRISRAYVKQRLRAESISDASEAAKLGVRIKRASERQELRLSHVEHRRCSAAANALQQDRRYIVEGGSAGEDHKQVV